MKCILQFKELFTELCNYEFVFIKTNVPYMPSNFPTTYAVGKDLDIMVKEGDIDKIRCLFEDYAQNYRDDFDIICIDETYGFRVRFQIAGKLHFQFDVKYMSSNLSPEFMKSMLKNRESAGEYYIPDSVHELIIRILSYTPNKEYHLGYIKNNIRYLDSDLITDELKNKTIDILRDVICSMN